MQWCGSIIKCLRRSLLVVLSCVGIMSRNEPVTLLRNHTRL